MATRKRATRASSNNGNGSDNGQREREQRPLECKLTEAEFKDRSDKMAAAELLIEQLKEQRKGVNGKIAAAATERGRLAHIIDTGLEQRAVECEWRDDYAKNVKRLVRLDTGVEVDTRPITADDRQTGLDLPPIDEPIADAAAPLKKRNRPRKTPPTLELHAH